MFKKLVQKIKNLAGSSTAVDPSQFADPVAERTEWTPAKRGGASFCTRKLVVIGPHRIEFRASAGAKIFYMLFFFIGIGVVVGVSIAQILKGVFAFHADTIVPLLVGVVFTIVGGCMFYFGTNPVVFDKLSSYFWKGRQDPKETFDEISQKSSTGLGQIHALQLISEYCRGDKSSYYSYELNLVLEDSRRINVVDHGNLKKIREDAAKLSEFLEKPLWDAV